MKSKPVSSHERLGVGLSDVLERELDEVGGGARANCDGVGVEVDEISVSMPTVSGE